MMGIIKRIRKKWRKFRRKRAENKKLFRLAKLLLKKGVYYISHEENAIKKVDRHTFLSNFFYLQFLIKSKKIKESAFRAEKAEFLEFNNEGYAKIVFLNEKSAYGFYMSKERYSDAKENYQKLASLFPYPSVKESFIDRYHCVVMDRVRGVSFCDDDHNRILLKKMFEFAIHAPVKRDPVHGILYLQQGDAKYNNVLWEGSAFLFIDLDGIGFYPPLFDVFHYLANLDEFGELSSIIALLDENQEELKAICEKSEIDIEDNPLDTLFYHYMMFYFHEYRDEWKELYWDFRFLTVENTIDFPKTNKLLRTIYEE